VKKHKQRKAKAMIQGVIFDYGNVLSATRDTQPRAAWEHKLGLPAGELSRRVHNHHSWVAAQCGRISVAAFWQGIGNTLRLTSGDVEQLRTDFYRGDVRNDALVARIDAMRQAGLRLGILSNFSRELWTLLERQDLSHRFDAIAVSADIGVMKPAPAAYHAILNMLRLPPEACLFIDDLPDNIAAAQALGLHGLVFRDSPSCLAEINRLLAGSLPS
jgi:putative hydrolase of the HAD superfamily